MKNIFYTLFLITSLGYSQSGFIEVEIRDSIKIKPLSFEYNVTIDDSRFLRLSQDGEKNEKEARAKMNQKFNELGVFLKSKSYQFRILHNENYEIHSYIGFMKSGYAVKINNIIDLNTLTAELKTMDYIIASIGEMEYEEELKSEKRLFKKLINKAKEKAETIAELSGLKLGRIIEFKEVPEIHNITFNIMDIYTTSQERKEFGMEKGNLFGQKWKAVIVKFATK
ncbi:SIMPL domain-containing protein [Aquimarina sp. AU119]|uniref:SIMPL domain-containing protein n=1 Tax=Aquimarina sp. AU119 TaxID=2108528 RepID=UPI000D697E5E|nr:SIMPL domain-containing protein [Aquimarina sp. AU119]